MGDYFCGLDIRPLLFHVNIYSNKVPYPTNDICCFYVCYPSRQAYGHFVRCTSNLSVDEIHDQIVFLKLMYDTGFNIVNQLQKFVDEQYIPNYMEWFIELLVNLKAAMNFNNMCEPLISIDDMTENLTDYVFGKILDNSDNVEMRACLLEFINRNHDKFKILGHGCDCDMIL